MSSTANRVITNPGHQYAKMGITMPTAPHSARQGRDFGFKPSTPLREDLRKFAEWYAGYYGTTA